MNNAAEFLGVDGRCAPMTSKYMPGQPKTDETAEQYQDRIAPLIEDIAVGLEMYGDDFFDK